MARGKLASRVDFGAFGATLGSCAGVTGVPAVRFRWSVGDEGGGPVQGFRPSHVRWSVFRRRRGTSPSPTLGRRRCRRPALPRGGRCFAGGGHCFGRLGMSAGGAGFRPSHVRWSVFRRRRGTSPSPTLGRRRCRRRRGMSAGGAGGGVAAGRLGMSAGGAGFRPSHVRWSVFRRRRGTSPSPTLGRRRCRRRRGTRAGHTGFRPGGGG